jgi:methionine-rich copper-binding protein CopC
MDVGLRRLAALGAVLVAALCLAVIPAASVLGHAKLAKAQPAPGARVTVAPKVVRAWFRLAAGEELDASQSQLSVWNAAGKRVDDGTGGVDLKDLDRRSMIAPLKPLTPGTYTVKWKAVSDPDGGISRGSFRFTYARP